MNSFLISVAMAIVIILLGKQIKKHVYLANIITKIVICYSILIALTLSIY